MRTRRGNGQSAGLNIANGPGIAGHVNWEQAELMLSQPNQFRDGQ